MPSSFAKAVIKTLAYADVFDYPLRKEEIGKWLIKLKISRPSSIPQAAGKNSEIIKEKDGFYFLRGREDIVKLRKLRERWSKEKIKIAGQVVPFLRFIPTVKLVGITGALAVNNAKKDDDIDVLIITSRGLLWTTRFFVTLLIDVLGKRRRPGEEEVNNKICLNMFMDEDHLAITRKEQDLFSAREVAQMKPRYDKEETYQKFLQANQWVKNYLPNSISVKRKALSVKHKKESLLHCYIVKLLNFTELLLKKLQLWYMRRRRTSELITDGIIRFHPQDARKWILKAYQKKLLQYSS